MTRKIDDAIGGLAPPMLMRRDLLKAGGAVLVGVSLTGCQNGRDAPMETGMAAPGRQVVPSPVAQTGQLTPDGVSDKPIYVAQALDPVAYSIADNLFWNDILMEHALFFVLLMPGPDLDGPRRQAEEFQRLFAQRFEQSSGIDAGNYVAFNQGSMDLARRFSDYKKTMQEQQESGQLHSLVWPLFFDHTAREADRFAHRLDLYSQREIEYERDEVVAFWSQIMSEHAAFIAHLLDPQEVELINQADQMQATFADPSMLNAGQGDPVLDAAEQILDFKTAGEKGIRAGTIKSIIQPDLAAHVRREAIRFIDELNRTQMSS